MKTTIEPKGKGHFEVEFTDGTGFNCYDMWDGLIWCLARMEPKKSVRSITWVED